MHRDTVKKNDFQDADNFFEKVAHEEPDKWAELEEEFPVLTKNDYIRAKYGEPISRRRKREGKKGGIPRNKRRTWDDDEWREIDRKRKQYLRDYEDEMRYAQELADEGM